MGYLNPVKLNQYIQLGLSFYKCIKNPPSLQV